MPPAPERSAESSDRSVLLLFRLTAVIRTRIRSNDPKIKKAGSPLALEILPSNPFETAPSLRHSLLLRQLVNVLHQGIDFIFGQAALETRHQAFPIGDDVGELRVRLALDCR